MADGQRTPLRLIESQTALNRCLEMFLLHQEASRNSPRTIETYRATLQAFLDYLAERDVTHPELVTANHIRRFFVHLEGRDLAGATIQKHARSVKAFCNFLVREEVLDNSPMRKVAMPRADKLVKKPFTTDDIEALLKACDEGLYRWRDRAIVLTLLDTGLRVSEFVSLTVGDVDRAGMIKVMGKGRKERYVRVGTRARKALLRYLSERDEAGPGEPLWVGHQGPLTLDGIEKLMQRLGERAGVSPSNPHRFRRTFATWSAAAGIDAHSLRFLLGHESLEIARRYVEMAKADIEEAHKRTSPVDNFLNKK